MRWLKKLEKMVIRVNEDTEVIIEELSKNDVKLRIENEIFRLNDIDAIWYRRGNLNIKMPSFNRIKKHYIDQYNEEETKEIISYVYGLLKTKKHINDFNNYRINKLEVLRYCYLADIQSAPFIITQTKQTLLSFYHRCKGRIITKSVKSTFSVRSKNDLFSSFTYMPTIKDIEALPKEFVPTFFQEYIEKRFEIRTFYLDGVFSSMAIFSQNNPRTLIDFRNYDAKRPNRLSPFMIPSIILYIRQKIPERFMNTN